MVKKKNSKDTEATQAVVDELRSNNNKLEKSRKRLQEEVRREVLKHG